jgi:pimeloyl-ACP methyl ester carboxylesterase
MIRTVAIGSAGCWLLVVPALAQEAKVVTFTTSDGVELVADFTPAEETPAPAVILLNVYSRNRIPWQPLIGSLHYAGMHSLCMDLRGHGESIKPESMNLAKRRKDNDEALAAEMHSDLLAAYEWLSKQPGVDLSRLGLVGSSFGCSVALEYARRDRSVDAVIGLCPKEKYLGLDSRQHLTEMAEQGTRRTLLIATYGEQHLAKDLAEISAAFTAQIVSGGRVRGTALLDGWYVSPWIADFLSESFGETDSENDVLNDGLDDVLNDGLNDSLNDDESDDEEDQLLVVAPIDALEFCDVGSAMDPSILAPKRRLFSSAAEAEARGLTRARGPDAVKEPEESELAKKLRGLTSQPASDDAVKEPEESELAKKLRSLTTQPASDDEKKPRRRRRRRSQ